MNRARPLHPLPACCRLPAEERGTSANRNGAKGCSPPSSAVQDVCYAAARWAIGVTAKMRQERTLAPVREADLQQSALQTARHLLGS
jgi:hypothetical protein